MEKQLEDLSADEIYELFIEHKIAEPVALRFKEHLIDGSIISQLPSIPVTIIPEIGAQIKFCDLFEKCTGRRLEYPDGYSIHFESTENVNPNRGLTGKRKRTAEDDEIDSQIYYRQVTYPAELPVFTDQTEDQLQHQEHCIEGLTLMIRELADFLIAEGYTLNKMDHYKKVCQTVLDRYECLNDEIKRIIDVEKQLRHSNRSTPAWMFLSKKLSSRLRYFKKKNSTKKLATATTDTENDTNNNNEATQNLNSQYLDSQATSGKDLSFVNIQTQQSDIFAEQATPKLPGRILSFIDKLDFLDAIEEVQKSAYATNDDATASEGLQEQHDEHDAQNSSELTAHNPDDNSSIKSPSASSATPEDKPIERTPPRILRESSNLLSELQNAINHKRRFQEQSPILLRKTTSFEDKLFVLSSETDIPLTPGKPRILKENSNLLNQLEVMRSEGEN